MTAKRAQAEADDAPDRAEPDDEVMGVDRTGAHPPLTDEMTGLSPGRLLPESSLLDADDLPAVLSSVSEDVPLLDEETEIGPEAQGVAETEGLGPLALPGVETDRTAAYDPPAELFAEIPDPEALPRAAAFHNNPTGFLPAVRPRAVASRPPEEPEPARDAVVSLFDPEPESEPEPESGPDGDTLARAAEPPTPAEIPSPSRSAPKPAPPGKAKPAPKKNERLQRPPGPMHRPVARDPGGVSTSRGIQAEGRTPAPAAAPIDPADNELTGIYEPPDAVPELPRAKLTIAEGENVGKIYYLNRNRSMVGRGIDNDIVLMDIAVSRKHVRVDRHADGFRVVDLASGNGTTLNGRRVTEAELYDGDRIDVGNTVVEFLSIGRARARGTAVAGGQGAEDAPITDHGRSQTPIVSTRGPALPRIPWTWVMLWAAATFLAVLVVLLLVRRYGAPSATETSAAAARSHLDLAEAAMRARDWKRAEDELAVARQLGPDLRAPSEDTSARIARERDAQRRLDEARRKVGVSPPAAVQALLLGIGRDSVYYAEARNLISELDGLPPGVAPSAPPDGTAAPSRPAQVEAAPVRLEPEAVSASRPSAPTSPATAAPPSVAGAAANSDAERRARADLGDALRMYREQKFDQAASMLDKAARKAPGTKTAKDAQTKAKLVRDFSNQWESAQKALRSRRAREAADALSRASSTDRRLGGHLRDTIDTQLSEQLYMVAIQSYNRQAYDEAIQANSRVLEIAPGHALATRLQDKMRRSALTVSKQAQQALDSGDRETARRLAQAALRLVGESDPAGKLARKVLDKVK